MNLIGSSHAWNVRVWQPAYVFPTSRHLVSFTFWSRFWLYDWLNAFHNTPTAYDPTIADIMSHVCVVASPVRKSTGLPPLHFRFLLLALSTPDPYVPPPRRPFGHGRHLAAPK